MGVVFKLFYSLKYLFTCDDAPAGTITHA